jgi:hypothetical protein
VPRQNTLPEDAAIPNLPVATMTAEVAGAVGQPRAGLQPNAPQCQTELMPANPLWSRLRGRGPHPGYLGGLLIDQPVMLRQPNLVAYVTSIRAYPEGLAFSARVEQGLDNGALRSAEPRVMVDFSDGRSWKADPDMIGDCLVPGPRVSSGGSAGASWQTEYWLPALPPPGQVHFSVSVGSATGTASVDGASVIAAARRADDLWSEAGREGEG